MANTIECALMAGASYISTRSAINRFPAPQGWTEITELRKNDPSSGFEATTFKKGTEIVISYAGTDGFFSVDNFANFGLAIGAGSTQLIDAAAYYLQVRQANPNATITFTGHSLGGGLAALMGVFFNQQAITFDQAPFALSASTAMRDYLVTNLLALQDANQQPIYTSQQLMDLAPGLFTPDFDPANLANSNVTTLRVAGEFTSSLFPFSSFNPIGPQLPPLSHGPTDISSFDLHAQSLLAAFVQNDQFRQVTSKLTDLLGMVFDSNLYANDTSGARENFLERLVRHQNGNAPGVATADAMLTRFTDDLWKLAQDGGLTMSEGPTFFGNNLNNVSKTLTAFAMQMYYEDSANATDPNKELFTDLTTANIGSGGIHFDRADVAATLDKAKGYNLYFQNYLNSTAFTDSERQLIQSVLPALRDWYVQRGRAA